MQRNWIGRSEGARVRFALNRQNAPSPEPRAPSLDHIEVFTTRIDTIYGANFILLAPEHPLVQEWAKTGSEEFKSALQRFKGQDRTARMTGEVEKEGFDTGHTATNPFTGKQVPVWVANFVLIEYGTGAVMGVPAHDQRDFEFARKYNLPITAVIKPTDGTTPDVATLTEAADSDGVLVNSGSFDGLSSDDARTKLTEEAKRRGIGEGQVPYRLE